MKSNYLPLLFFLLLTSCAVPLSARSSQANQIAANYNVQLGLAYLPTDPVRGKQKLLLALQEAPKWSVTWDALGYYYENIDDPEKAKYYYQKALYIAPTSGSAQNNYGAFLCKIGEYREAMHYLRKATLNSQYLNTAKAFENLGICSLSHNRNRDYAENCFLQALKHDPSSTTAIFELSNIYFQKKQYLLAHEFLLRYLKYQPNDPQGKKLQEKISKAEKVG